MSNVTDNIYIFKKKHCHLEITIEQLKYSYLIITPKNYIFFLI